MHAPIFQNIFYIYDFAAKILTPAEPDRIDHAPHLKLLTLGFALQKLKIVLYLELFEFLLHCECQIGLAIHV